MSNNYVRELEQKWESSRNQADGEALIDALLRTTSTPTIQTIIMLIRNTRALNDLMASRPDRAAESFRQPVTVDDIISFLHSDYKWLECCFLKPDQSIKPAIVECDHPNEVPFYCSCDLNCNCKADGNQCSDVKPVHRPSDRHRLCDRCDNIAIWYFCKGNGPQGYICGQCLSMIGSNRAR